ncbi:ABC transporter ATP-binding protein [Dactylosporangium sp. NPDC051484]|uniref:ABC transporter ATP-binding protein n=1 Tax=Dactylosporangium sp. NPDC051484 TaxID=3154942 RepID=UPI00344EEBA1
MLELVEVGRTYDDGHPVHALRHVSLRLEPGEYVTITGPSGAGKSTLLNVLGLLDVPSSGSYLINGMETGRLSEGMRGAVRGQLFGFVFQAFHLLAGRTAVENVEIGMLYGPHGRRRRRELALAMIEQVGLGHRAHADPRTLSGGEKQRVAIARAVAPRPQVLFCDEPTGNLDNENSAALLALLRELNGSGLTIVMVTHDPHVAQEGGRRLCVSDGTVSEQ